MHFNKIIYLELLLKYMLEIIRLEQSTNSNEQKKIAQPKYINNILAMSAIFLQQKNFEGTINKLHFLTPTTNRRLD
jgi:hypothetical protein